MNCLTTLFISILGLLTSCTSPSDEPDVRDLVVPNQKNWIAKSVSIPYQNPFESMIVFGDSLSDTANLKANTWGIVLPAHLYWEGRFSNGPIWLDYASRGLQLRLVSYAVGGAETQETKGYSGFFVSSLHEQIDDYLNDTTQSERKKHLGVIWIGANNYFAKINDDPRQVIEDISKQAQLLLQRGLQTLVIGTMPELAGLPVPPNQSKRRPDREFKKITRSHNTLCRKLVSQLQKTWPRKNIVLWDAYDIYHQATRNPIKFGFRDLDTACYPGDLYGEFKQDDKSFCVDLMGTRHWDYTHPNTMMHCYYATKFLADLGSELSYITFNYNQAKIMCRRLSER
ncbi:SGNH/GDSL hydrolase family protein [Pseudobacteriovorax antillogorgiicola]|uniref:Phospholipase/lecithinase/hemolysin n=1 Tax=Pseudobacteriovorax antillogorgiicola TaxID=1513793 RepID=A0A1Y6CG52_9BACT|nr:SGNH/GDSL hydrolase family protein [Pseudobacteriovorax antillogorgiicola]TCS48729.1 phospholipase/lecithinase/hemolysin [Pseudobacteriovorax antillogorgiicola]SMF54457.1 Phospholipase/lecithinase/hemolysin [Pseudobacteriovorax antillogorgiicola]